MKELELAQFSLAHGKVKERLVFIFPTEHEYSYKIYRFFLVL